MNKISEFIAKHKVPILIVLGIGVVYVLYELFSSSSSSSNSQNAALQAAQEQAAEQEAALQAAYASQGTTGSSSPTASTSVSPTVAAVTPSTTSPSGAIQCPSGYQLDPTGTFCQATSGPAPIATTPTGVTSIPGAYQGPAPVPVGLSSGGGSDETTLPGNNQTQVAGAINPTGIGGTVGGIVGQWAAILAPNNPFIINNPALAQGAAQNVQSAVSTFCTNNPGDPSCSAANVAAANNAANAIASNLSNFGGSPTFTGDNSTETSVNNPAPTSNGTGGAPYASPVTGGQRIANFLAGGQNSTPLAPSTSIPATGTTPAQPVSLPTVASSRGLTPGLPALATQGGNVITAQTGTFLTSPVPSAMFNYNAVPGFETDSGSL